jgi:hypothetical protein
MGVSSAGMNGDGRRWEGGGKMRPECEGQTGDSLREGPMEENQGFKFVNPATVI